MGKFFGDLYDLFEAMFGQGLAQYLWYGPHPANQINLYWKIGLLSLIISICVAVMFYYVINHPRCNTWWWWSIFLVANSFINFIVGWQWIGSQNIDVQNCMSELNELAGGQYSYAVSPTDYISFGWANFFVSMFFFIVISFMIKYWSRNCSSAPFRILKTY